MKLFQKIFIISFALMAFISILVHGIIYFCFPYIYLKKANAELKNKAKEISKSLENEEEEFLNKNLKVLSNLSDINIYVKTDLNSEEKFETNNLETINLNESIKKEEDVNPKSTFNTVVIEEEEISLKNGKKAKLQFVSLKDTKKEAKDLSLSYLPYTMLVSFLISFIFSYIYAKIIVSPINNIKKVLNEMTKLDEKAFLKINSNDEIGKLKKDINKLYKSLLKNIKELDMQNKKLKEIEKRKNEFLKSTSHELKTPIAAMRIMLENMKYNIGKYKDRDKYLDESLKKIDVIEQMLKEFINLASATDIIEEDKNINLKKEIEKIIEEYKIIIDEKNIKILNNLSSEDNILIGEKSFRVIIRNLISNACKFTNQNGKIKIGTKNKILYIFNINEDSKKEAKEKSYIKNSGIGKNIIENILKSKNIKYKFIKSSAGFIFLMKIN